MLIFPRVQEKNRIVREMGEPKLVRRSFITVLGLLCVLLLGSTVSVALYYNNAYATYTSTHSRSDAEYLALATQFEAANTTISDLTRQITSLENELSNNNTQLKDLVNQVANLRAQVANNNKTVTTLQDYYNSLIYVLNTEVHDITAELMNATNRATELQNQVDSLMAISSLNASTVWVNNQTVTQAAGTSSSWMQYAGYAGYVMVTVSSSTPSTYATVSYSSHGVNYNVQTNVGASGTAFFPVLPANITVTVGNGLSTGSAIQTTSVIYYY